MSNKNNVPEIRVNGFSDEWVKRSLNQVCSSFGYGLNASAIKYDGLNKYLRITDIDDESRLFDQENLTSPGVDLSSKDSYLLAKGDIVFARTGASVGKTYLYNEKDNRVYYAGFLIRARVNHDSDRHFVFQNTLTKEYQKFVTVTSQRSGQPGINATEYSEYELFTPLIDEQIAVGNYFQKLDTLINQHQEKHDKLSNLKKAMLEKMFPKAGESVPEIRFEGFSGNWVRVKLSEVADKYDNLRIPITSKDRIAGNTPYYGANGIQGYVEGYTHDGDYVLLAEDGANDLKNYPVIYVKGKIWVNNHAHVLQAKGNGSTSFLRYVLSRVNFEPFLVGGGRAKLNASVMMDLELTITFDLEEQRALADYFQKLDALISQHSQQITKLKNIKQACLDKMFV